MQPNKKEKDLQKQIEALKTELSELQLQLEERSERLNKQIEKREFYQLIADFTFGWELWLAPSGKINYCSPSCFDLTGYTSNQIISAQNISDLLVYELDSQKFNAFIKNSLDQTNINTALEFRILTRTKQMRWCSVSARAVYNERGRYLGVRASIRDISKLKHAMGSIKELETGKEFQNRSKQRLQTELELKDRELVSILLQLSQKNEIITKIENLLKANPKQHKKIKILADISQLIEERKSQTLDWIIIERQIEKLYPGFFERLQKTHPLLTSKDKKLCAFLRLELSSKEISGLLNITPQSVEIARVRLRKKLKISSKMRLTHYFSQL